MRTPKLTHPEMQVMEALWRLDAASVREIQESLPEPRPAYTTVQTVVYRLERKQALRCVKRVGNANIFAAALGRDQVQQRLLDEMLAAFRGRARLVMARLVDSGELTVEDIREAESALRQRRKQEKRS